MTTTNAPSTTAAGHSACATGALQAVIVGSAASGAALCATRRVDVAVGAVTPFGDILARPDDTALVRVDTTDLG